MAFPRLVSVYQAMKIATFALARSSAKVKAKPADAQWQQDESGISLSWFMIYPIIHATSISE